MVYPNNFEEKIGFDRIRQLIKNNCISTMGAEFVEKMRFSVKHSFVNRALNQVTEFLEILASDQDFPVSYYIDARSFLNKIKVEGLFMTEYELFDLKRSLETIRSVSAFFKRQPEEKYPNLREMAADLVVYPYVIERIDTVIGKNGEIRENASPQLSNISRELASKKVGVSKRIQSILKQAQASGWVETDVSVAIRDGKMLIPVAATFKRKIKGIVYDESATGKTSYIEPTEVVELNNDIRELEFARKREIIRILTQLSDEIRPYAEELIYTYDVLGLFDFVLAKAKLSRQLKAIKPQTINRECRFEWYQAVHPLLYLTLQKENKDVVPLDVRIEADNRLILISGPNAGGKSVCLKTVGLVQYMFQCGMPVPVLPASQFCLFDKLFIDIGDEQSLENDLSTYSSHLKNMKYFAENADGKTLLLIDEFGTGTEPMLGGAIAEAVLQEFNECGANGVITTHYTNLKHFATSSEGIVNAAMLFDSHRMQPLFKLQIGEPGSSYAFEIAKKIGLPQSILQNASDKIGQDHINFDKHLKDIQRDKRYAAEKRKKIRQEEKRLEDLIEKYNAELGTAAQKRKEIIAEARTEAQKLLTDSNRLIERTIMEIKQQNAEKEKTREARKKLDDFKREFEEQKQAEESAKINKKIEKLLNRELEKEVKRIKRNQAPQAEKAPPPKKEQALKVGDKVKVKGQDVTGEVLSIKDNKAEVSFGVVRMQVELERLIHSSMAPTKDKGYQLSTSAQMQEEVSMKKLYFKPDLDVRGKRMEEAIQLVTNLVDEAVICDVKELRILHGTGFGILRQAIRQFLKVQPIVKSCRDEHLQLGGAGITIVELDF